MRVRTSCSKGFFVLTDEPERNSMSGKSTFEKKTKAGSGRSFSRPFLCGSFCFALWLAVFILTGIYEINPFGYGLGELSALKVFRARFLRADFGSYTFDDGMGTSIFRIYLKGFGGILTYPVSLLPVSVHPQALVILDALRLALAGAFFSHLIAVFRKDKERKLLVYGLPGILYSGTGFLFCLLLRFPVADTLFFFPLVLLCLLNRHRNKETKLSLTYIFSLIFCLTASAAWDLIVIPLLLIFLLFTRRSGILGKTSLQSLLALGLCAFVLLPQFLQFPYAVKGEPSSAFLRELGNDTNKYRTDVTFSCEAMELLLHTSPSLFVVARQSTSTSGELSPEDPANAVIPVGNASSYPSLFEFYNEWFYTLWPSLSITPFQETAAEGPLHLDTQTFTCTMSTLFMDPLYCALTTPSRTHAADVYVDGRYITTVSENKDTVLINLGTYNVGQTLTLKFVSPSSGDLVNASVKFGYLNSFNWNRYTAAANFGITAMEKDSDGITADGLVAYDSTLLSNIPYEKGWSLYLNGEKTPVRAYRDAWLCADVTAGNYVIHLHYTAPGSAAGGWISGLSFILLAVLYARKKGHSSSSSEDPDTTSSSGAFSKSL